MNNDTNGKCATIEKYGRGILNKTADFISEVFDIGNIAVVKGENCGDKVEELCAALGKCGYAVRVTDDIEHLPECVKYVLGAGGKDAADKARAAAKKLGVNYSLVPFSPCTDSFISDKVSGEDYLFPDLLIIDEDVIENAPKSDVAAGYGRVIAQLPTIFDIEFDRLIFADDGGGDALGELAAAVGEYERHKEEKECTNVHLMQTLNKIGRARAALNIHNSAVDSFARVLSENLGRSEGETSFIASYMVLYLYRMVLSREAVDILPPSDVVKSLKLLEKMRIINYNNHIARLYVDSVPAYMKESFVLNEYRRELYEKLDGLDLSELSRYWRRLYDDAGFWLKSYATGAALMRYLAIAAELSENCMLKYLKRLGFLEKFV